MTRFHIVFYSYSTFSKLLTLLIFVPVAGVLLFTAGGSLVLRGDQGLFIDDMRLTGAPTTVTLRKLYDFDPVPDALAADRHHHILGVQANAWTEHMRTWPRVQHAIFPRIAALAESAWSLRGLDRSAHDKRISSASVNPSEICERLGFHLCLLRCLPRGKWESPS